MGENLMSEKYFSGEGGEGGWAKPLRGREEGKKGRGWDWDSLWRFSRSPLPLPFLRLPRRLREFRMSNVTPDHTDHTSCD